jgi:hypothetical protein
MNKSFSFTLTHVYSAYHIATPPLFPKTEKKREKMKEKKRKKKNPYYLMHTFIILHDLLTTELNDTIHKIYRAASPFFLHIPA